MKLVIPSLIFSTLLLSFSNAVAAPKESGGWTLMAGTTGGHENMLAHYDAGIYRQVRVDGKPAFLGLTGFYATSSMETDYGVQMEDAAPDRFRLVGGMGVLVGATPMKSTNLQFHIEANLSYAIMDVTETSGGSFSFPADIVVSIGRVSTLLVEGGATLEFLPTRFYGFALTAGAQSVYYGHSRVAMFLRGTVRLHFP